MADPNVGQTPITLRSSHLTVEIAAPGSVYAGTRFDWTGLVTQVMLGGKHTFCMPESLEPGQGSGGIGLCNEFGIDQAIGYDDVSPGEMFLKLGIGLLKRPDAEQYNFFVRTRSPSLFRSKLRRPRRRPDLWSSRLTAKAMLCG